MINLMQSRECPLLIKKKYLRLFLVAHLTQNQDLKSEIDLQNDLDLIEFFKKVIIQDLMMFPKYLRAIIKEENQTDKKKYSDAIESVMKETENLNK